MRGTVEGAYLDTLALGQTDPWLLTSDDEHVGLSRGKGVVYGILDVHNIEASVMAFTMGDNTDTAHIATASSHGNNSGIKANELRDLTIRQIKLDSVIDLNSRVWVTDPI